MMLQSSLSVGASPAVAPPYWFNMPFWAARGSGIVSVIGRWNLRRRGSMVTIGLTATRLPSIRETRLGDTGCACVDTHHHQSALGPERRHYKSAFFQTSTFRSSSTFRAAARFKKQSLELESSVPPHTYCFFKNPPSPSLSSR